MAKVRILQIVTRLAVRGVPRHVLEVAARLDPSRFAVEVMAGRSEPGEGSLWEEARDRGIRLHRVEPLQRAVSLPVDLAAFITLYRRIRQGRYDLVHTHISKAGFLGRLAARCARVPVVVHTYHGQIHELQPGSWQGRVFLACERVAARGSDALVAVSQDTAEHLLSQGIGTPGQYRVIRNGIDLTRFQPGAGRPGGGDGRLVIGTIASLTREKGLEVLVQALAGLVEAYPDLHLCIVGDGPERGELQAQVEQLGLQHRVQFAGMVADVRPWLAGFDLFVVPSISEGIPLALLEAMAMGRPVVASCTGGIPEVVQDRRSGWLVPPGDPAALGEAIGMLLGKEALRRELGQRGRARVEEGFEVGRMVGGLEELYQELLGRRGRG